MSKEKTVNIEKVLFPDNGELTKTENGYEAELCDPELDSFKCEFSGQETVKIDTDMISYILLDKRNLLDLLELINESEVLLILDDIN